MHRQELTAIVVAAAVTLTPVGVCAQTAPAPDQSSPGPQSAPEVTLPTIEVIGTTPLPGTGIDRDKVPANVQSLNSSDLVREGTPSVISSLVDQVGSVNMNANLDDPFQPDLLYRGFEASPVLGTPQGIAVYQSGVRINEAFGDTVNWDLIPDVAIDRIDVLSSNPVYGLNALGGAAVITMKNGFTYHGFEVEGAGGSFGQRSGTIEYGQQAGNFAGYIAGRIFDENGWRQFSPDHVKQLYADVGARSHGLQLDLSFSGTDNNLFGEGATPEQELAAGRSLDFTTPQSNVNTLAFFTLNGSYQASDTLSFQGNVYRREFHQAVINGNTTDFVACTTGNGLLCQSDGLTPLVQPNGANIPDISQGGTVPIGENDTESIHTVSIGTSLQTTYTGDVLERENNFAVGGSFDHSNVSFESQTEVGIINSSLQVEPGFLVETPENSSFNATPVALRAADNYYGLFATDTFNVTPAFALTASGRYNVAEIDIGDQLGVNLTGQNRFDRFNPAIGATYKILAGLTVYAGYSEGNRVPTPSEIECSNPAQPCLLPSSLSSDPPSLKQVVSHTYEAGLRGTFQAPEVLPGRFRWNFGLFRTDLTDDIFGVATSVSSGFFENIAATRRQGIEAGLAYRDEKWSIYGLYSLVDATFQTSVTLPSPSNPFADANGNIQVSPGDRLPGIPENQLKVGGDYRITPDWTVGAVLTYFSDQFLLGDESNQNAPLPGYEVVSLHTTYDIAENFQLFASIQNLLDAHYATFGVFGDPTAVGAPGIPTDGIGVDNRFVSPAPPISVFGGIRVRF